MNIHIKPGGAAGSLNTLSAAILFSVCRKRVEVVDVVVLNHAD